MRQVVLDTETTGLSPQQGHRLTEIGCLELIDRKITGKTFHTYLDPEREVDFRAAEITGLTWDKLKGEPKFIEVATDFSDFIADAELIIHNAPFDLGFLESEFIRIESPWSELLHELSVIDTLVLAKEMHPGQRNNLDALCKRYNIDNSERSFHGALLDSEILAQVYLTMTAGQTSLQLDEGDGLYEQKHKKVVINNNQSLVKKISKVNISDEEINAHEKMMQMIRGE